MGFLDTAGKAWDTAGKVWDKASTGAQKGITAAGAAGNKGKARIFVSSKAEGLIVLFAETGWLYHTLIAGGDSLTTHGVDDADNFCVYHALTGKICWLTGDGKAGHIFRIHDGTHINVYKKSDTEAGIDVLIRSMTSLGGLHQCVGSANNNCHSQTDLRIDSLSLEYPWELPTHLKEYKAQKSIKWVS